MKKKAILTLLLVVSVCLNLYFLIERHNTKEHVNFVYHEANAYMVFYSDMKGAYYMSSFIRNTFGLPSEEMIKSMEKTTEKLRKLGNEKGYYDAVLKLGNEYEFAGRYEDAITAYGKYLKKYPNGEGAFFDVKAWMHTLQEMLENEAKGGKRIRYF